MFALNALSRVPYSHLSAPRRAASSAAPLAPLPVLPNVEEAARVHAIAQEAKNFARDPDATPFHERKATIIADDYLEAIRKNTVKNEKV